jgi:long-subunit acyl-CoA synthetase (AMP-forming)
MPLDITHSTETRLTTPLQNLYQHEATCPEQAFLHQPINGELQTYTWSSFGNIVRRIATRILAMELPPHSRIGIFSKNCAEWFMTDLAIMMAGHVSVPIFATAGQETISYVLAHAEIKLLFVGKLENTEKQLLAVPDMVKVIAFPYPGIPADEQWAEFIDCQAYGEHPIPVLSSPMTIIYTSGSTGKPKGVVHTYESICWSAQQLIGELSLDASDRLLSYLPLAHITERVFVELVSFYSAHQIYFIESLETFQRDVKACQPTLFVSVPRLWTKFQMGILAKLPQTKLNVLLSIPIVKNLVKKKIIKGLGFEKTRLWASGSAPLAPVLIEWFNKLGVRISEGWGMTENCAYGTACVPFREDKIGCIGKPFAGVDIRISDEGEIQVNSISNMKEYYLDPEKTAEVFTDDGYLRTGDKGVIDSDNYVKITGRLKDIFKTTKGKYVTPAPIEGYLMENSFIEQVCVTGSNLPQPIALLVLSEEAKKLPKEEVTASFMTTLNSVNSTLESHQVLDRLLVVEDEWTVENEFLTPTLKVKRHVIESVFAKEIQAVYSHKVVWL